MPEDEYIPMSFAQMSEKERISHLQDAFNEVIERFRGEYQITYASVIGVLEIVKFDLLRENEPE